jgi:hypothetical protein
MENHADLLVTFDVTGDLARRVTFRAHHGLGGPVLSSVRLFTNTCIE